jgi:transglutaminase-like putative cysteine protease
MDRSVIERAIAESLLLLMEAARSMGFAARFVATLTDRHGLARLVRAAAHAWRQIYIPRSRSIEFNSISLGNRDLISVAVGRTLGKQLPSPALIG